jgi:hypothetical protein
MEKKKKLSPQDLTNCAAELCRVSEDRALVIRNEALKAYFLGRTQELAYAIPRKYSKRTDRDDNAFWANKGLSLLDRLRSVPVDLAEVVSWMIIEDQMGRVNRLRQVIYMQRRGVEIESIHSDEQAALQTDLARLYSLKQSARRMWPDHPSFR